ncbi:MAG: hypothetical protein IKU25_05995 [Clostridia bacterium]|nr:hypothetical protein [Clostridia bacterium]
MKNYDETINIVFERIAENERTKRKNRKTIMRAVCSFGCVCLIALVGIGVWHNGKTPVSSTQGSQSTTIAGENNDLQIGTNTGEVIFGNGEIFFNTITEKIPFENPDQNGIAVFRDDEIPMTKEEINEYFGINVFPTCPYGFEETPHWLGIFKRNKGTGDVYFDTNQLQYTNADNSKTIAVTFGTNCVRYLNEDFWSDMYEDFFGVKYDDIKKSNIDGVEFLIVEMAHNQYYAEFTYEGVMFSVFSENATRNEFLLTISSIISQ